MSYLVAIDQSTSATKALLVDAGGAVVDACTRDHTQHYPQPGWVEHDAAEIAGNVFAVARELCGRHEEKLAAVRGVSITNQRETFVVFDRTTGEPLRGAIVWQCRRGDAICQQLRDEGLIDLRRGRGAVVTAAAARGPELLDAVRALVAEARRAGVPPQTLITLIREEYPA